MDKLKHFLELCVEGKKKITIYDITELEYIYKELMTVGEVETINSYAKKIVEKCGLHVKKQGVGWLCSL